MEYNNSDLISDLDYSINSINTTKILFFEDRSIINSCCLDKYKNSKILILTEKKLYEKFRTNYIEKIFDNVNHNFYFIEEGDFFKTQDIVDNVISFMFERSFDKSTCIIGLGGGKITDLAGYIASVFLRGVDNILIPTNLLAMVDASIGGKTAINDLKFGKNLIGTIYQPKTILINLWMLNDLYNELVSEGMSEIIKMFSMFDKEEFYNLCRHSIHSIRQQNNKKYFYTICKKAIQYKVDVISKDVTDKGIRNVLNFGHTIGHAVESVEALNISHGKSVAIGLVTELEMAVNLGLTSESTIREMKDVLENFELPIEIPKYLNPFLIIDKMKNDKKNSGNKLKIVVLDQIGKLSKNLTISLEFEYVKNFISRTVFIERSKPNLSNEVRKIIKLKGSKSICNRALVLSALGQGEILLQNYLFSEDTIVMIKCLRNLGVDIESIDESTLKVVGKNGKFENIQTTLKVENAGTAARFLVSLCAICKNSEIIIDGNSRMRERPIGDLLESISTHPAIKIEFLEDKDKMPFKIITKDESFKGEEILVKSKKSSQYVTSLLLSSPFFKEDSTIRLIDVEENEKPVSYQYIEMTVNMMKIWGVEILMEGYNTYKIKKSNYFNPINYLIEPDASTANFYLSFIALHGGEILINGIGKNSIQGDSKFCYFLTKISPYKFKCEQNEKDTIFINNLNKNNIPVLFDEDISIITDSFLALGVVCSQIPGRYIFRGLANQAIKESNRLEAIALNLNRIGIFCNILNNKDGIEIISTSDRVRKNNINFVQIDTHNDHRIAMAFAVLGSFLQNTKLIIDDKNCVNKTYPEFWKDFDNTFGLKYTSDYFDTNKSIYKLYYESYINNPVFLIGMRSCGKSTFGKFAADQLSLNFIDFDLLLLEINSEFKSIEEIVSLKGWEYFRQLERNLFYEIFCNKDYKYQGCIIACGGGIVENEEILLCLKSYALVIFIDTHIENIKSIIKLKEKDSNKPEYKKDIDTVYNSRIHKYKYCTKFIFKTPYLSMEEINHIDFHKKIVSKIGDMFAQFVYTTCNPMKYPLPEDPSYFLSIVFTEKNFDEIFDKINKLTKKDVNCYHAIEFRADHLINNYLDNNLTKEEIISKLIEKISNLRFRFPIEYIPIIFTIRSKNEGGFYEKEKYKLDLYQYINKQMTKFGIEIFDIEFDYENVSFIEEFYQMSKVNGSYRIILSKHYINYYNINEMKKDIYTMSLLSHDVAKIITSVNKNSDYEEIKTFINNHIKKPLIHFQLGESNAITRILNTFMSPVYDDKISQATGKGQLTLKEIENLRSLSGFNNNFKDRFYYVVGNPVTISPSPFIYETAYKNLNENESELPYSFDRKNLFTNQEFIDVILNQNKVAICSVTIPFKEVLFNHNLENKLIISEEANFSRSINCVRKINYDKIICINTDWIANYELIIEILKKLKKDLSDIKILILGAGGASIATILSFILINFKKENIFIKNRTQIKSEKLIEKFGINNYNKNVIYDIIVSSIPKDADEAFLGELIDNYNLNKNTCCLDLAYTKGKGVQTNFRKMSSIITENYISGLEFLLKQAYYSYEIFSGRIASRKLIENEVYQKFYY